MPTSTMAAELARQLGLPADWRAATMEQHQLVADLHRAALEVIDAGLDAFADPFLTAMRERELAADMETAARLATATAAWLPIATLGPQGVEATP